MEILLADQPQSGEMIARWENDRVVNISIIKTNKYEVIVGYEGELGGGKREDMEYEDHDDAYDAAFDLMYEVTDSPETIEEYL